MSSSRVWKRSSRTVGASGCQYQSRNSPGFDPSIRRHSGIWGAADEAVLNNVHEKEKKKSPFKDSVWSFSCGVLMQTTFSHLLQGDSEVFLVWLTMVDFYRQCTIFPVYSEGLQQWILEVSLLCWYTIHQLRRNTEMSIVYIHICQSAVLVRNVTPWPP